MKILMPFISLFVISFSTFAQNHLIGIKGGLSSTLVDIDENWDKSSKTGFIGGLAYQYNFGTNLFIGCELLYEERGFNSKRFFSFFSRPTEFGDATVFKYNYISLPLKFGYQTGGVLSGFCSVGIIPAKIIKSEYYFPWNFEPKTLDVTDNVQQFDLAGLLEIGGNYKINHNLQITLSFAYQYSFTTVTNNDYLEASTIHNYGFSLTGGVKYALRK